MKSKRQPPKKAADKWIALARGERDPGKARVLYEAGLAQWPQNARLLAAAADHLANKCRDRGAAEALYRRAIEADPDNGFYPYEFAEFLCRQPGGWKKAAEMHRARIRCRPDDAEALQSLADILTDYPADFDGAERLYRQAASLRPIDPHNLRCLAGFLRGIRGDPAAAARLYARAAAIEGEGSGRDMLGKKFLREARRNAAIERPLRLALARDPENPASRLALGLFLIRVRHQFEEGESFLRGTLPPEMRTPAALRAAARIFESKPETGREWACQIEWAAQLAPYHAGIARKYAKLKRPAARFFDEGTESLM